MAGEGEGIGVWKGEFGLLVFHAVSVSVSLDGLVSMGSCLKKTPLRRRGFETPPETVSLRQVLRRVLRH